MLSHHANLLSRSKSTGNGAVQLLYSSKVADELLFRVGDVLISEIVSCLTVLIPRTESNKYLQKLMGLKFNISSLDHMTPINMMTRQ